MNDASEEDVARSSDADAMRRLALKLAAKSSPTRPARAARKEKEKQVRSVVDGRSLRAKGRSAQVNIKVRPEIKERLARYAEAEGVLIADWFEQTVEDLPVRG